MTALVSSAIAPARSAKAPPGPLEYLRRWPLRAWLIATAIFLYAPLITLIVFSFNDSKRNIVWRGFTLKYYKLALADTDLITAFGNSLTIAAISTLASVILGALTALMLWRFRFPGKAAFEGALAKRAGATALETSAVMARPADGRARRAPGS